MATTTQASPGFSMLLGDFDRERFFARHWEARSVHLPHGDPQRFAHLVSPDTLFEREVKRCMHLKASARDAAGWNQEIRIQPEQAPKMFRAGFTICASMLDESGPCGELIQAYRRGITTAAPPHVNCYYSPDARGYGLHFDTHPVWILQVSGSKHWTVSYEPAVRNPPFNVIYPPGRDRIKLPWVTLDRPDVSDRERFMDVRLDPGHVLYIPAGCWHAARAEGASLALTLALGRVSTLDLLDFLLVQTAQRRLHEVTDRLPPVPAGEAAASDAGRAELRRKVEADLARLKELVERIDAEALLKLYEFHAEHPEAMLASRQFMAARDQVRMMKALYSDAGEEAPSEQP